MKRIILFSAIIFLFSLSALSQDYAGKARTGGIVTDQDGNPIEGVKVKLFCLKTESGLEKYTDDRSRSFFFGVSLLGNSDWG